jgi:hypothetical protein
LYRVRLDGTGLEKLTSSPGCHVQPFTNGLERLFYVHVNCGRRGQHVEELLGGTREEARVLPGEMSAEPDVSPDGKLVLVTAHHLHAYAWELWRLSATKAPLAEGVVTDPAPHLRPRFGRRARELLYQRNEGVFVEEAGRSKLLSPFVGGGS